MTTVVLTPPEPIVTPADIPGTHAADDAVVAGFIQAVTEEIDGPTGWVGRCFGKQALRLTQARFCARIPLLCPPVIRIVEVGYLDADYVVQTVSGAEYRLADGALLFNSGFSFPATACAPDAVRVIYEAGYDGESVGVGGTGPLPERAKAAIVLGVAEMLRLRNDNPYLVTDRVEGIGTRQFDVTPEASAHIRKAMESMLGGLHIYSL